MVKNMVNAEMKMLFWFWVKTHCCVMIAAQIGSNIMHFIKALIRAFFYRMPKVGDKYVSDFKDPFQKSDIYTVLDTQRGYILHNSTGWGSYSPTSCKRSDFHFDFIKFDPTLHDDIVK